jgi:ethanolamine utilization cobalamin adenosyltransferase
MTFLTEADLRAMLLPSGAVLPLPAGTKLGPLAKEYCADRGIQVVEQRAAALESMTMAPPGDGYIDAATGEHLAEKPEHMTHLYDNVLVPKTNPRICLRGKLDSVQALFLQTARAARETGHAQTADDLDDMHAFVRVVLACEVKDEPLPTLALLHLDSAGLRHASHHPQEFAGMPHPVPNSGMPALCLALNYLRTQVREAELAAAKAFEAGERCQRPDLVEALNRLSSAVYLLFLRELR